jgi:hypothetical protein
MKCGGTQKRRAIVPDFLTEYYTFKILVNKP